MKSFMYQSMCQLQPLYSLNKSKESMLASLVDHIISP